MALHIKTLLGSFLQPNNQKWKVDLLQNWPQIMGSLARNVTIIKIYQNTIILGTYDSCWLQELYLLSPMILETINQNLDRPRIKQVRFKQIGRPQIEQAKPAEYKNETQKKPVSLTSKEQETLQKISDPRLRATLKSFLIRCHRERKK